MFSMEQLESFVAVAEEQHFGRAAVRLHITQPPLSRRIQLLEEQLGVDLFDRSRRAVRLTAAGRVFLVDARKILALAQEAALSAQRMPRGEIGVVTIGFTAASAYSFLERVVSAANAELPGVELVLREMVSAAQLEALLSGTIDIGMIRPPATGADIMTRHLFSESMLAAVPAGHQLAQREFDPVLTDFDGEQFIGYSPSEARYFYEILVGVFRVGRGAPGVRPVRQPDTHDAGHGEGRIGHRDGAERRVGAALRGCGAPSGGRPTAGPGGTRCRLAAEQRQSGAAGVAPGDQPRGAVGPPCFDADDGPPITRTCSGYSRLGSHDRRDRGSDACRRIF